MNAAPMSEGLSRIYLGEHNFMRQEWQDDGSVIVTVMHHRDQFSATLHIDDLYGPTEELLQELVENPKLSDYIVQRQAEAEQVWQAARALAASQLISPSRNSTTRSVTGAAIPSPTLLQAAPVTPN